MSVPDQTPFTAAVGNGVTTAFPFQFLVVQVEDLVVSIDGIDLANGAGYTVTGLGVEGGGTVSFFLPPPAGLPVLMRREIALLRSTDYQYQGEIPSETLNDDFDRLWLALQGFLSQLMGSIRAPIPERLDALPPASQRANKVLSFDSNGNPVASAPTSGSVLDYAVSVLSSIGSSLVGFVQAGAGALVRTVQAKLRERKTIADYLSLAVAFQNLGGPEGNGFGVPIVELDLLGNSIDIGSGDLYWPLNVRLVNGDVRSSTGGRLILCSPYVRNPGLRPKEAYWPYMIGSGCDRVSFNCRTIISGLLRGVFRDSLWEQANSHLVLVNSNGLWTEYNQFPGCEFAAQGGSQAILLDGNLSGMSPYSVGTGAGTADGSFGYNLFPQCKLDSTAPKVGMQVDGGGVLYGSLLQFRGYARGAGGAMFYLPTGPYYNRIAYSDFDVSAESFGAAANIVSVEAGAQLWYNTGSIRSASPEMTFNNAAGADLRANDIRVFGPELQDSAGNPVFLGGTRPTTIFDNLNRRRGVQPMFRAHRSADDTFPSGTTKQISMDAIDADTDSSAYTGGGFSPKFAGWYRVTGKVRIQATATASACSLELRLNGAPISINGFGSLGAMMERDVDELLFLNGTTDVVTLHVLATDPAGPPTIIGSSTATSIAANFVRA